MKLPQMIVQIYEVTSAEEARALSTFAVDHIGVLVGDGAFPREQSIEQAGKNLRGHFCAVKSLRFVFVRGPELDQQNCVRAESGDSAPGRTHGYSATH